MARLTNWTLMSRVDLQGNPYQILAGKVYGHPKANKETGKLCDGNNVVTSRLCHLDLKNKVAITQSGTVYDLDYPDAKEDRRKNK